MPGVRRLAIGAVRVDLRGEPMTATIVGWKEVEGTWQLMALPATSRLPYAVLVDRAGDDACDLCKRVEPCECGDGPCRCSCGSCSAPLFPMRLRYPADPLLFFTNALGVLPIGRG